MSDDGFMNDEHLSEPISNPSFLGIQSLAEGFIIVMFSRTHYTRSEFGHIYIS